jgi:hypothetical protein
MRARSTTTSFAERLTGRSGRPDLHRLPRSLASPPRRASRARTCAPVAPRRRHQRPAKQAPLPVAPAGGARTAPARAGRGFRRRRERPPRRRAAQPSACAVRFWRKWHNARGPARGVRPLVAHGGIPLRLSARLIGGARSLPGADDAVPLVRERWPSAAMAEEHTRILCSTQGCRAEN